MKKIFKTLVLAASMAASFTAYAQDQEIRLFSHRGGRLEHDENTMYAFKILFRFFSLKTMAPNRKETITLPLLIIETIEIIASSKLKA